MNLDKNIFDFDNLYKKYYNNVDFKEKIYLEEINVSNILSKLENNNIKILVCNEDYTEASGGITVLHYFCHLLNYVAKRNIAYITRVIWLPDRSFKKIDEYSDDDCVLKTNPEYLTPYATKDIIMNKNNIVIYMDSIYGNPLEQKYVIRWVLYFELSSRIKTWGENDLIIWFIDTYKKYSKHIQRINNEEPTTKIQNKNKEYIMPIISNINRILSVDDRADKIYNKQGACFTIRKIGDHLNSDRRLTYLNSDYMGIRCENCNKNIWPCVCYCKNYTNGVKIIHNEEKLVYRFEYPVNLNDEIELFRNTEKFYMYDPFCFSAVIAVLNGCLTIVPKLESFGDDNPYENVEWMQYGISYGIDEQNINQAKQTLHFVKENLTKVFYNLNYESIKIFFDAINEII